MADAYIGEIRAFAWNFPPEGWLSCNGSLVPVQQYNVLYSILGITFGGTAPQSFGVPNLQGRSPMASGQGPGLAERVYGQPYGVETVALTWSQMPNHTHLAVGGAPSVAAHEVAVPTADTFASRIWNTAPNPATPIGAFLATANTQPNTAFAQNMIGNYGQGQAHENRQPLLVLNFCVNFDGIYPVRPN